jgi:hypothetical protein
MGKGEARAYDGESEDVTLDEIVALGARFCRTLEEICHALIVGDI